MTTERTEQVPFRHYFISHLLIKEKYSHQFMTYLLENQLHCQADDINVLAMAAPFGASGIACAEVRFSRFIFCEVHSRPLYYAKEIVE